MKRLLARHETYVFAAIVIVAAVVSVVNPAFLTVENLFDMAKGTSFVGILAIGILFVLISGNIDISFTAVATVGVYATMEIMLKYGGNIFVAFLISCIIGIALELLNASIIYFFAIPSIITTIATLNIYYGILTVLSRGKWLHTLPAWFRDFSDLKVIVLTAPDGHRYGLSIIPVIWLAVIVVAWVILKYTTVGRGIYAMGGSLASARRAGFNILRLDLFVFGFMGLMCGIAGVVQGLLTTTIMPNFMVGKELDVIAAVVLGGASLFGGTGTLVGTLLGVVLLAVLSNGMTLMRISSLWYNVLIGLVILISVSISAFRRKKKQMRALAVEV